MDKIQAGGFKKSTAPLPSVQVNRHPENPLEKLAAFVTHFTQFGGRILLLAESMGHLNSLRNT